MLTSSRLVDALDLSNAKIRGVRERYGKGDPKNRDDGGPKLMEHFLIARRLVEAGARCVTLGLQPLGLARRQLQRRPPGHAAARPGLVGPGAATCTSAAWTTTCRSSCGASSAARRKINTDAGRDHWPHVSCALLAGGGMRTGQVIGSTDRTRRRGRRTGPVQFQEVFATLYHRLGIDANRTTLPDLRGRPQYLVDHYQPLRELV